MKNLKLTYCSALTLNIIPREVKSYSHFKQRLLPNCWLHGLENLTIDGGGHSACCYQGHRETAKNPFQLFCSQTS